MSTPPPATTRFAPSPTGLLHRGHAFSACLAHDMARELGGRFLVRLEDIDAGRSRAEFAAAILDDLDWLGLEYERPPLLQSTRQQAYEAALETLRSQGLLYRCFRTRREVLDAIGSAPHGPAGPAYFGEPEPEDREAERLAAGDPFAWRLSLARAQERLGSPFAALSLVETGAGPDGETGTLACDPSPLGDVVLARKDVGVAYHLAVVVDDAFQGVTHVVRGEDLFHAAPLHVLLQALLGLARPIYHHHRLILGPDGKRLAKRDRAETLAALRAQGVTPDQIRASFPDA